MMKRPSKPREMIKRPATIFLMWGAVLLVSNVQATADPIQRTESPLWEKATEYLSRNHWIPGEIAEHERTYDAKGKLTEASRLKLGFSPGRNGLVRLRVLAAKENGKDVAEQARSAIDGDIPLNELIEDSPFLPKPGRQVTYWMSGVHRKIEDLHCTGFKFTMRTQNVTAAGTAWLDQKTGLPVEIHTRITTVPFMEEDLKITAYQSSEYFTITPQGHCHFKRSHVKIYLEAPETGFKGRVVNERVGNHHWKYGHTQ